jgi:hypothetical protein
MQWATEVIKEEIGINVFPYLKDNVYAEKTL